MSVYRENIKRLREERGLTQEDIAKLLGISKASVSKYEAGIRKPDIETMKILSKFYNVSVDYILGLTEISTNVRYIQKAAGDSNIKGSSGNNTNFIRQSLIDKDFYHLAAIVKKNNLSLNALENVIDSMLMLKQHQKSL